MARITMRKTQETKLSEIFTLYLASAAARGVKDKTLRTYEQHFNAISKRLDVDGNTDFQLNSLITQSLPVILETTWGDSERIVSHKRSTTFSRVANASFRKPRFRISFQICSMGFISGVYGGMRKRTIFSGNSRVADLCQAAPSQQSSMISSE